MHTCELTICVNEPDVDDIQAVWSDPPWQQTLHACRPSCLTSVRSKHLKLTTCPHAQIYDPATPQNYELGMFSDMSTEMVQEVVLRFQTLTFPFLLCCHAHSLCEIHEVCIGGKMFCFQVKCLMGRKGAKHESNKRPGGKQMSLSPPGGDGPLDHSFLGEGAQKTLLDCSPQALWVRVSQTLTPSAVEHCWCFLNPESSSHVGTEIPRQAAKPLHTPKHCLCDDSYLVTLDDWFWEPFMNNNSAGKTS